MNVVLNGEVLDVRPCTLVELINGQGYDADQAIVEHNGLVIRKDTWPEVRLNPGDAIEVIRFVGGG